MVRLSFSFPKRNGWPFVFIGSIPRYTEAMRSGGRKGSKLNFRLLASTMQRFARRSVVFMNQRRKMPHCSYKAGMLVPCSKTTTGTRNNTANHINKESLRNAFRFVDTGTQMASYDSRNSQYVVPNRY